MADMDLDELERIGKEAGDGPWQVDDLGELSFVETNHRYGIGSHSKLVYRVAKVEGMGQSAEADAQFIVAARNNWQAMIDEIKRLRKINDMALEACRNAYYEPDVWVNDPAGTVAAGVRQEVLDSCREALVAGGDVIHEIRKVSSDGIQR
jgi:hypothetical protein